MEITVREFRSEDTKEAIAIWNEVVEQGKAFPQMEGLGMEDGEAFFKEQSYTGIAVNENDECPFCFIERKLEQDMINFVLGSSSSYMESDIREQTDKIGFCRTHMKKMFDYG